MDEEERGDKMGKLYELHWNVCGDMDGDITKENLTLREARILAKQIVEDNKPLDVHWRIYELIAIKSC